MRRRAGIPPFPFRRQEKKTRHLTIATFTHQDSAEGAVLNINIGLAIAVRISLSSVLLDLPL